MKYTIEKVLGPRTASVAYHVAVKQLMDHPEYPKEASIKSFADVDGQWVAELKVPVKKKAAPAFMDEESPAESSPMDEAMLDAPDEPKDDKSDKKPDLSEIMDLVKDIAKAVGVSSGDDEPSDELKDALEDIPPADAPPPPKHEPSKLKPGEVLPSQTPVGAPAFSHTTAVPEQHPWKDVIGKVASFTVSETTDMTLKEIKNELDALGKPFGYEAKQMTEDTDGSGARIARALMTRH